jgi:hypothetical protein
MKQPPQNLGAFLKISRLRKLSDITSHESLRLDSTAPAIAVGRTAAGSIVRMPPRDVPMNIAGKASIAVRTARTSANSAGNGLRSYCERPRPR